MDTGETPTPAPAPAPRRGFFARHKIATVLGAIVLLPVLGFALWAMFALNYSYSDGDRAGLLQKFSSRGWICKTWEGELVMSAVPGSAPEKFIFSVRSDSIAKEVNKQIGRYVSLHYEQHKNVPTSCFGDTEYFVTAVKPMTDSIR
jgi:hypothetical protein